MSGAFGFWILDLTAQGKKGVQNEQNAPRVGRFAAYGRRRCRQDDALQELADASAYSFTHLSIIHVIVINHLPSFSLTYFK